MGGTLQSGGQPQPGVSAVFSSEITVQGQETFPSGIWEMVSFSTGKTQASKSIPAMEGEEGPELGPGKKQLQVEGCSRLARAWAAPTRRSHCRPSEKRVPISFRCCNSPVSLTGMITLLCAQGENHRL